MTSGTPKRTLRLFDLVFLGANCVIGSGIFTTPGVLAENLGPYAPLGFLLGGAVCFPIAMCFAIMARHESGTGGAYQFATRAFGREIGFLVGWVMWMSGLVGLASVALPLGEQSGLAAQPTAASIIALLALSNYLGTRTGAWTNNLLSMAKLVPLILFCGWGLFQFGPGVLAPPAPTHWELALLAGALPILYAFSGFEEVPLPAGEVKNPERNVPKALLVVLALATTLYALVAGIALHVHPGPFERLTQATAGLGWIGDGLRLAAIASLLSVNASIAFTTPRSLWALARDGWVTPRLARLDGRFGTPAGAIVVSACLSMALVLNGSFKLLLQLSVLASLVQHLATVLACARLHGWRAGGGSPIIAAVLCAFLLSTSSWENIRGMLVALLAGWLFSRVTRVAQPQQYEHQQAQDREQMQ